MPSLAFTHLFGTTMVITNVRYTVLNLFTIQLQDDTECTMRRRVVRTQVQEHKVFIGIAAFQPPVFWYKTQMLLFIVLLGLVLHIWRIFSCTRRVLFTKRMTFPVSWQENTTKHRMTFEVNPEHVISFAFIPVGIWPDIGNGTQVQVMLIQRHFNPDIGIALKR